MIGPLLLRELRAQRLHLLIGLGLALLSMATLTVPQRNFLDLRNEEGIRLVPWLFSAFFALVVTHQGLGREWSGGGQRLRARLAMPDWKIWAAKVATTFLTSVVFATIVHLACPHLVALGNDEDVAFLASSGSAADAIWSGLLVFALGVFFGTIVPNGAAAIALACLTLGGLLIGFEVLDQVWLRFHDVHPGLKHQIAVAAMPWLSLVFLIASASVFFGGRLHRHRHLRTCAVALLAFVLCAIPATVTARMKVAAWESIDLNDPTLRIGRVHPVAGDPARYYVDLSRPDHLNPHVMILNVERGEVERFLPGHCGVGRDPADGLSLFVDPRAADLAHPESDWRDAPFVKLGADGSIIDVEHRPRFRVGYGQPSAWSPTRVAFTRIHDRRGLVVDRRSGREIANYKLESTWSSPLLWKEHWLSAGSWMQDGQKRCGLVLQDVWSGELRRVEVPELSWALEEGRAEGLLCTGRDERCYVVGGEGRAIFALDPESWTVELIFEGGPDSPVIREIASSRQGRHLRLSFEMTRQGAFRCGVLNLATRHFHALDDLDGTLNTWSSTFLFKGSSPQDRHTLFSTRRGGPLLVLDLESMEVVSQAPNWGWTFWIDDDRLLIFDQQRITIFDLRTQDEKLVFRANR